MSEFGILDPKNIYFDKLEDSISILLEMLTFGGHDHIEYDHLTCKHGQNLEFLTPKTYILIYWKAIFSFLKEKLALSGHDHISYDHLTCESDQNEK